MAVDFSKANTLPEKMRCDVMRLSSELAQIQASGRAISEQEFQGALQELQQLYGKEAGMDAFSVLGGIIVQVLGGKA